MIEIRHKDSGDLIRRVDGDSLAGIDFREDSLIGADLSGQDLSDALMQGADLSECDLSGANLLNAQLQDATLSRANLAGAMLRHASLLGTHLEGGNLDAANLQAAKDRRYQHGDQNVVLDLIAGPVAVGLDPLLDLLPIESPADEMVQDAIGANPVAEEPPEQQCRYQQ